MNIVLPPDGVPDVKWNKTPTPDQLGNSFFLIQTNYHKWESIEG